MNMQAPGNFSLTQKLERVEQVIRETGLQEQADIVVGNGIGLGLSGGQVPNKQPLSTFSPLSLSLPPFSLRVFAGSLVLLFSVRVALGMRDCNSQLIVKNEGLLFAAGS